MPKVRVYDLAKELSVENKVVLNSLSRLGVDVKNALASVEEKEAQKVRDLMTKGQSNSGGDVKQEAQDRAEKPMNTETAARAERQDPPASEERKEQVEHRGNRDENRPQREGARPPRPEGPRPMRNGDRPPRPENRDGSRPVRPPRDGQNRPENRDENRGARPPRDGRPPREGEYRPRPEGSRPPRDGNRPPRPEGSRPPREGEYRPRPEGSRPPREGEYRPRPEGSRPPREGEYRPRPEGSRPPREGEYRPRPEGSRPPRDGERSPRPFDNNRPPRTDQRDYNRPPRPQDGRSQDSRPPRPGQEGRPQRPAGSFPPNRAFADKDADPRDNRGPQKRPPAGRGPAPKTTTAADKPDKHERQQKIEASKRNNKKDRIIEAEKEKIKIAPKHVPQKKQEEAVGPRVIAIPPTLTLKELAEYMNKSGSELVKSLMKKGRMIGINEVITIDIAGEIALDYNILVEEMVEVDILEEVFGEEKEDENIREERPPVVVVMGHVDHGKTSLLDAIRKADVASGEAGGITQHIGAYTVTVDGKPITFLDTPGHEAFTAMRMRGAQVTDIAILVVAADDGVMPQTIEAISHAKAAGVEIIVAINKIDKPSANLDRVKQELAEHGLLADDWGGETICVPVSAASKQGIDSLLEMILLVAEMKEYKANPGKKARGTVIEASLDKGKGPVATVLVQDGTLEIGDPVVAGVAFGKIRAMMDDKGRRVKKAGPSIPVEILGLSDVPLAGDQFNAAINDKQTRYVAETLHARKRREINDSSSQKVTLEDLFAQIQAGNVKELAIIVKADVQGSVEAVKASLEKLSNNEVHIKTILGGVGAVTESDVMLAAASNAIIIGFNVRPEAAAKSVAEENSVDIRLYRVIYHAIEDIQAAMKGMLDPVYEEKVLGHAEIRQLFKASSVGTIGGSYITDGKFARNAKVRVVRDGIVVYDGELATLKRFKDDVKEVNAGYECGLLFNRFNDIKEGDKVEAYVMEEIKR